MIIGANAIVEQKSASGDGLKLTDVPSEFNSTYPLLVHTLIKAGKLTVISPPGVTPTLTRISSTSCTNACGQRGSCYCNERWRYPPPSCSHKPIGSDAPVDRSDGLGKEAECRKPAVRESQHLPLHDFLLKGEELRVEGLGAGAEDYLVKPFTGRELFASAKAHVSHARERRCSRRELVGWDGARKSHAKAR